MNQETRLPPNVAAALGELKPALVDLYGERLRGVYLYGSHARGDFHADSDVDVLIVLVGPVVPGEEINRYSTIRADICLRYDLVISTLPVAEDWFNQQIEPLYQNVVREGVPV
jgi:predicted nucleotidyltransferase